MIPLSDDNPTSTRPTVTISLLVANALVFLYQLALSSGAERIFIYQTAAIPYELTHFIERTSYGYPAALLPFPLTVFTAMFVHGGFMHAGGNMLYLWIFGNNVEDAMGHGRFLIFYLLSGVGASLVHIFSDTSSTIPMIGASGAIAGILGAYFVLYPQARIKTLIVFIFIIQVIHIPAILLLGIWFLMQLMNSGGGGGGVAWYAHIGGFLIGLFLVRRFERPRLKLFKIDRSGEWKA